MVGEAIHQVSGESGVVRDIQVFGRILHDEQLAEHVAASPGTMLGFGALPWVALGLTGGPGYSDALFRSPAAPHSQATGSQPP